MKKGKYFLLCVLLLFFSCQKKNNTLTPDILASLETPSLLKLMDPAWKSMVQETTNDIIWEMQISPAFPDQTSSKSQAIIFYAYALGKDLNLSDGVHVSEPWGYISIEHKNPHQRLVALGQKKLRDRDIQGVKPLTKQDDYFLATLPNAQKLVIDSVLTNKKLSPEEEQMVADGYCTWRRYNGVIASAVEMERKIFWQNLHCDD